jgi:hypothetical protein
METSNPSLIEIDRVIAAAEKDTRDMNNSTVPRDDDSDLSPQNPTVTEPTVVPNPSDLKSMFGDGKFDEMFNKLKENPAEMEKLMSTVSPDMIKQVQQLFNGGKGAQSTSSSQRNKTNNDMRSLAMEHQRMLSKISSKDGAKTKKVIFITANRVLKVKSIPDAMISVSAGSLLKCTDPIELSCSRLALGPLTGKTIKVWYDPSAPGRARRSSKILGFSVGSSLLIVMDEGDLTEKDFTAAESELS